MSDRERARRRRFRHFMDVYHAARHAYELQVEAVTAGYAAELAEYRRNVEAVTFKRYLTDSRGLPR